MKVCLLNVVSEKRGCLNKDVMSGMGSVTRIGDSLRARAIELSKKFGVKLPVFSFAYLAAIFSKAGWEVEVRENSFPRDADLVIVPSSIVDCKNETAFARRVKRETNASAGTFGPFASAVPEFFLKDFDFVIAGEPENAAIEIAAGKKPKGIIKSKPVENLDGLPFPAWGYFPVKKYSYFPQLRKKPFIPILSSRGCVHSCEYCPYRAYEGNWRRRSPENVVSEISHLKEKFGMNSSLFRDPLFSLDRARVEKIAEGIIKERIDLEWACETRTDLLDEKLVDKMFDAGLRAINIAVESSDEKVLDGVKRKAVEKIRQEKIIDYCEKKGIRVAAFYVLGLPGDTEETVESTIEYAKKLNTNVAQFTICTPFPGTPLYEKIKGRIFEKDWEKFDSFTPVFRHENISPEKLNELKEKAFVSYYFRPGYLKKFIRGII